MALRFALEAVIIDSMSDKQADEQFSLEETARRGDTLLLQLLKTPPRPREKLKAWTKRKPSRAKAASQKPKKSA